jgi:hypothetical protein
VNLAPGLGDSRLRALRHSPYILLVYATRAAAAFIVASALASIATRSMGAWPGGDLMLWEPGGLMLSEMVRLNRVALTTILTQSGLIAVSMIPVGIVTSTLLLVSLSDCRRVPLAVALQRCGKHLLPMSLVYGVMTCLQIAVVWFFYILAELLTLKLEGMLGVRGADLAYVALIGCGAVIAVCVAVVHDLIRATIVARSLGTLEGIASGWHVARKRPFEVFAALWSRAAGAGLIVLCSLVWAREIGMGTPGRVASTTVVLQASIIAAIVLRASWLSRAAEIAGNDPRVSPQSQHVVDEI